jgi:hypothetical protein
MIQYSERERERRMPSRIPDASVPRFWRDMLDWARQNLAIPEAFPEQLTNHSGPSCPSSPGAQFWKKWVGYTSIAQRQKWYNGGFVTRTKTISPNIKRH